MDSFTDYYTLLGVDKDAPSGEIKAAFKRLALQYHPDVYKGNDAHERMRLLLAAYQTLSDPEERKRYNARYGEFVDTGTSQTKHPHTNDTAPRSASGSTRRAPRERGSSARRDRQRQYDFPDMHTNQAVRIDLGSISYTLSPQEAATLQQQGMLRGIAPEAAPLNYYCHRCSHRWRSNQAGKLPHSCPQCHATDWTEYLLLRCVHCCAVFESEQIRYEIGTYAYGDSRRKGKSALCPPYELFPLCPYCGTAHWCPAEDARVSELRERAAQGALRTRISSAWRRLFWW
jgi:hypothetical protein